MSTVVVIAVLRTSAVGKLAHKLARAAARELQLQFKDALVRFDYGIDVPVPTPNVSISSDVHSVDVSERIERE